MTIKATFPNGTVMMFGNSYKRWENQLREFCNLHKMPQPEVVKCKAKWVGYGGLKWCTSGHFPEVLREEGEGRTMDDFTDWRQLSQIELRTLEKYVPL